MAYKIEECRNGVWEKKFKKLQKCTGPDTILLTLKIMKKASYFYLMKEHGSIVFYYQYINPFQGAFGKRYRKGYLTSSNTELLCKGFDGKDHEELKFWSDNGEIDKIYNKLLHLNSGLFDIIIIDDQDEKDEQPKETEFPPTEKEVENLKK